MEISWSSYRTRYNALSDVDAAYAEFLAHKDGMHCVLACLNAIRRHGLRASIGVGLLHRHFRCPQGTAFVERALKPGRRHLSLLITAPEPVAGLPGVIAGHRFALGRQGQLLPLEFTTDSAALAAHRRLARATGLHREVSGLIRRSGLQHLLGLAIYPRSRKNVGQRRVYLEETEADRSVTRPVVHFGKAIGRLIPTLWVADSEPNTCCTPAACVAYCTGHYLVLDSSGSPSETPSYCGHRKEGAHLGCV